MIENLRDNPNAEIEPDLDPSPVDDKRDTTAPSPISQMPESKPKLHPPLYLAFFICYRFFSMNWGGGI